MDGLEATFHTPLPSPSGAPRGSQPDPEGLVLWQQEGASRAATGPSLARSALGGPALLSPRCAFRFNYLKKKGTNARAFGGLLCCLYQKAQVSLPPPFSSLNSRLIFFSQNKKTFKSPKTDAWEVLVCPAHYLCLSEEGERAQVASETPSGPPNATRG